jgi:hypothetical protein
MEGSSDAVRRVAWFNIHWSAPLGLLIALAAVYAVTIAPGLSWHHNGADGGDLIAAAASGGVPHPTGYPAYMLLARLFLLLPFGPPAFRTNLLSSVCAAVACALIADIVRAHYVGKRACAWVGGLLAGFALGVSPLLWSQAVITEVYSLHALLVAASLRALPTARDKPPQAFAIWGCLTGLALTNHLTAIFLAPLGFITAVFASNRWRAILFALAGLVAGAMLYALLPIWAVHHPAVNWGGANTLAGFLWVVTGEPYRGLVFGVGSTVWVRVQTASGLLVDQFGVASLILALGGLFVDRRHPNALRRALLWIVAVYSIFAIGYNSTDSFTYLLPVWMAFAISFGVGVAGLLETLLTRWRWLASGAIILAALAIFSNAIPALAFADAAHDDAAERFGQAVLNGAPPGAIVVTQEDRDSFTLWYWREAAHQRRDLIIVVERLARFGWYRDQLRWTYPDLLLPAEMKDGWLDNLAELNQRPVCRTVLDRPEVLDCLSISKGRSP